MNKVAVVILNWNGKHFLEQFLPNVVQHSGSDAAVYVIDNASTDDSVIFIQEHFPTVKCVVLDKNYGFATGYNLGLKEIDATYYILLNSDVEVTSNWIAPIIEEMDNNPSVAVVQPKIKDYKQRNVFEYAGAGGGFIDKNGYPFCRGRIFNCTEEDTGQYDNTIEVFWASGACMFIRAKLYHEINGFDDAFFAHMEEIDLCWRLKNLEHQIIYSPKSTVYHIGGGTLKKNSTRKTFLNFRNNLLTLNKNLPNNKRILITFKRLVLDALAGIYFLCMGQPQHMMAVVRAHFSFYALWRQNNEKRLKNKDIRVHKEMKNKNILLEYFVKRKNKFNTIVKI